MAHDQKSSVSAIPVILVHGFLSTAEMLFPLAVRLRTRGFDVHFSALSPLCVQDVRRLGAELRETVDGVLEKTGAPKCHLVGLSQGGIIGLYYVKRLGGGAKVGKLVTVATPFGGTWTALPGIAMFGMLSVAVWQALPGSELLQELAGTPMPEGVEVTSVAIEGDLIAPPPRCHLPGARNVTVTGPPVIGHQWLVLSPQVAEVIEEYLKA